jgi:hypothetical protein
VEWRTEDGESFFYMWADVLVSADEHIEDVGAESIGF